MKYKEKELLKHAAAPDGHGEKAGKHRSKTRKVGGQGRSAAQEEGQERQLGVQGLKEKQLKTLCGYIRELAGEDDHQGGKVRHCAVQVVKGRKRSLAATVEMRAV